MSESITSEKAFQSRLLLELSTLQGVTVWRQNVGTVRTADQRFFRAGPPKGAADIGGVVSPGLALQIECKAEGRRRTPEQVAFGRRMLALGAIYYIADARTGIDSTMADLRKLIAERRAP